MQDAMETTRTPAAPAYIPHPCTAPFPPMSPEQKADFLADVERNGLREAIIIDQHNRIVDGVHRYRACMELGITPTFDRRTLTDEEAWALSISRNLARRHLSEAQRAAISAELRKSANLPVTQAEAARTFNISERTQRSAEAVMEASPDLHQAVKNDHLSVHAAETITKLPQSRRAEAIDKVTKGDIKGAKTLAKTTASSKVKRTPAAKKASSAEPVTKFSRAKRQEKFEWPAVYAPMLGSSRELMPELDKLASNLSTHPLPPSAVQDLLAELHRLRERVESAIAAVTSR